jgi:hypothetical protein
MSYFDEKQEGNVAVRKAAASPGLSVPETALSKAETCQWEHSSFSDPGDDWSKLHLFDKDGETCGVYLSRGY